MSSKSTTIVNLVLVFFISLLSFSIGTFVGKKYSDNQHQLAALEPSKTTTREVASVHNEEGASEKVGSAMSDEEIAKLAEEFVTDENAPKAEGHGEESHGTTTAAAGHGSAPAKGHETAAAPAANAEKAHGETHAAATTTTKPSAIAQDLAAGKTPATGHETKPVAVAASKENRVPSSLPKDVAQYAVGKFTVQVASYGDEAEAKKLASDLKNKGYSAFYAPANVKGKTWYRVSVGQFATQKEAQTYRGDLIKEPTMSGAMVQKITE